MADEVTTPEGNGVDYWRNRAEMAERVILKILDSTDVALDTARDFGYVWPPPKVNA